MVRKLYLLRHAEAGFPIGNEKDFDRNITYNGIQTIKQLAAHLKTQAFHPEYVYCSSAVRTEQTVNLLFEGMTLEPEISLRDEIYDASIRTLFELVTQTDNLYHEIMIVGHNPAISYLAEYLTGEAIGGLTPGQLVRIEFGVNTWSEVSQGLGSLMN